jgi:hypothetical protein
MLVLFRKHPQYTVSREKSIRILLENLMFRDHHKLPLFLFCIYICEFFVALFFSFMVTICRNYIFSLNFWHSLGNNNDNFTSYKIPSMYNVHQNMYRKNVNTKHFGFNPIVN